ncbi:hypothetical protein GGTG_07684 [Gaeumannomyces tritici R3-111a-1]|uniref:Uncharacterized protein n=1 Tax=Gaeumannomyces tritici (strain R3-111a-1) TaxID=644352 RepID=J3P2D7_GAET3|nr:hypothetical protein GGTG_07684 [Gaeumannomyces tritici R3-111a-1]EJT73829.1 hypothetical protein GGTG_07684 [Gaeumannomyces tritici R3-111a-1]
MLKYSGQEIRFIHAGPIQQHKPRNARTGITEAQSVLPPGSAALWDLKGRRVLKDWNAGHVTRRHPDPSIGCGTRTRAYAVADRAVARLGPASGGSMLATSTPGRLARPLKFITRLWAGLHSSAAQEEG